MNEITEQTVILVTGGASGIGAAICRRFAAAGARVAVFDRNATGAADLAAECGGMAIVGDAASEPDIQRAVRAVMDRWSAIDVLANNAGIEIEGTVVDLESGDWDRLFAVNVRATYLFSKYAIPAMPPGSSIVNISSIDALSSYPKLVAYDASKAAILAMTRSMAIDHGPAGIRVNAICPGYIETPLLGAYFDRQPDPVEARRTAAAKHPIGHLGTPGDVAEAALFLSSKAARFITGTHLVVDGGLSAQGQ